MLNGNTHSVGPPQRLSLTLGHADVVKLALALQLGDGPVCILERNVRVYAGGFEEVETLSAAQDSVDPVDTSSQVLRATVDDLLVSLAGRVARILRTRSLGPTAPPSGRPVKTRASVTRRSSRQDVPATNLHRKKGAVRVLGILVEEPSNKLQVGGGAVGPVKFTYGNISMRE